MFSVYTATGQFCCAKTLGNDFLSFTNPHTVCLQSKNITGLIVLKTCSTNLYFTVIKQTNLCS